MSRKVGQWMVLWGTAGSLLVGLASYLHSAPLPLPRPPSEKKVDKAMLPRHLVGEWVMKWGGADYDVVLMRDGRYTASIRSVMWIGNWKVDKDGTITVSEAALPGGFKMTWSAKLARCADGKGSYVSPHVSLRKVGR